MPRNPATAPTPHRHSRRPVLLLWAALCAGATAARAADGAAPLVTVPRVTHPGVGQVIYFVLTDRFANGSTANDTGGIAGGPTKSGFDPTSIGHYHGGDLAGLTSKLDYIRQLGATAVWITPPFVNQAVALETGGYHGYWILDFTRVDPHLGTEAEFREFVSQAHARGLRVYLDIVCNHTADVIRYEGASWKYVPMSEAPYRDASGRPFNPHDVAYNGVGPATFPELSPTRSFPYVPVLDPGDRHAKTPEWLNDVTLYHNRGSSTFRGESSLFGDFGGLDDLFTEHPRVVLGFIDAYAAWIEKYGIDGFRIDTVKHVNLEFWQAFAPAIRERARRLGKPDFIQFGEVADDDVSLMSEFATGGTLDGTLDFALRQGERNFISRGGDAAELGRVISEDGLYTDHRGNAQGLTTFVSNHDDGRFGTFVENDNPGISLGDTARLVTLAYDLLLTARGQPAIYYGDEQGMIGLGNDKGARAYMRQPLLGTARTGRDDKFDEGHPFYRNFRALAEIRAAHPGLRLGAMIVRDSASPHVFAFSRIERSEQVEYLVALNNSRDAQARVTLPTSQPEGALLDPLFDSASPGAPAGAPLRAGTGGAVDAVLAPLQLLVWRAERPLPARSGELAVRFSSPGAGSTLSFAAWEVAGHVFPVRQELRAELAGGDGFAEVTFAMRRASRPAQYELLGTSDAPPYRVFWRPPADLAPGETLTFIATADDLRGRRASAAVGAIHVAPSRLSFGIRGAAVPELTGEPAGSVAVSAGGRLELAVEARGTAPMEFGWLHDGVPVAGATGPILRVDAAAASDAGRYVALVRNREGTALSAGTDVRVSP
jgi:glycosidase